MLHSTQQLQDLHNDRKQLSEATIRRSRNQSEQIRAIIIGQSIEIRIVIFQMTTDSAKC